MSKFREATSINNVIFCWLSAFYESTTNVENSTVLNGFDKCRSNLWTVHYFLIKKKYWLGKLFLVKISDPSLIWWQNYRPPSHPQSVKKLRDILLNPLFPPCEILMTLSYDTGGPPPKKSLKYLFEWHLK